MVERDGETVLDLTGLLCPLPVLKAGKRLAAMAPGAVLTVIATDPTGNFTASSAQKLMIKYVDTLAPNKPAITGVFDASSNINLGTILNAKIGRAHV